jgi:hypothetical protein
MNFETEVFEFQAEGEVGGVFSEGELNELAGELLSIQSEAEFDHFLGGLLKKAASAVGSAIKSPIAQQVGGMLKGLAKQHLPSVATTLGGMAGGALGTAAAAIPGVGPVIAPFASSAGAKAGSWLGQKGGEWLAGRLELEALSGEEVEYEMAKQFVRVAGDATRAAVTSPPGHPVEIARSAVTQAVQRNAPGLLQSGNGVSSAGVAGRTSGRWVRRGAKIVVLGA